jgi:hypothetical protein
VASSTEHAQGEPPPRHANAVLPPDSRSALTGFHEARLLTWGKAKRASLIGATLMLVKAWVNSGKPVGKQTWGSYEAWAATGGFSDEVKTALRAAPALAGKIANMLLQRHFPKTLHADILQAVGLDLTPQATDRRRDPTFRKRVLTAYEYRWAVCGFDVRLIGVSVAYIRWVQAPAPDEEKHGLTLCVLQQKLFDLGAFTLDKDGRLLVSEQAHGTGRFDQCLMRHHGKETRRPQRTPWFPDHDHLDWHGREVFRGEARHLL